jgi:hypothetical protein
MNILPLDPQNALALTVVRDLPTQDRVPGSQPTFHGAHSPGPVGHPRAFEGRIVNVVVQLLVGDHLVNLALGIPHHDVRIHPWRDLSLSMLQAIQLCRLGAAHLDEPLYRYCLREHGTSMVAVGAMPDSLLPASTPYVINSGSLVSTPGRPLGIFVKSASQPTRPFFLPLGWLYLLGQ